MKTYFGVDYHKSFSYGTIVTGSGEIIKQGRFPNDRTGVEGFLGDYRGHECSAVIERLLSSAER